MQTQRVDRTDAEKIYMVVKNVNGATITTGLGAALAIAGNSFDGINAVLPTAGNLPGFVGVALKDIPVNSYGLIQVWGFNGSILLSNVGSSLTINQGDPLVPSGQAGAFFSSAPTYANAGFKYIVVASNVPVALSAGVSYVSGLVRCL